MSPFRPLPGERSELYSPIGLRLLDELTGAAPLGRTAAFLDLQEGAGWRSTAIQPVRTPGGVVAYPGLERRADASGPSRRYRVRIVAELYRPEYLAAGDGIELDAFPWNDTHPPRSTGRLEDLQLLPAPQYPFAAHVPVLRGVVLDGRTGSPASDALVTSLALERTLSDERGEFALPLRFMAANLPIPIDAVLRDRRKASITVTLPAALAVRQTISIP